MNHDRNATHRIFQYLLNMRLLFYSLCLWSVAFFIHLAVWRLHLPKRQTAGLLVIFLGTLVAGLLSHRWFLPAYAPAGFWENLHGIIFHVAGSLAYIVLYSAVEGDSPSLTLVYRVSQAGTAGLGREDFLKIMTDDYFVVSRIRALIRDHLVSEKDGMLHLTPKGRRVARVFSTAAAVLGLQKGG